MFMKKDKQNYSITLKWYVQACLYIVPLVNAIYGCSNFKLKSVVPVVNGVDITVRLYFERDKEFHKRTNISTLGSVNCFANSCYRNHQTVQNANKRSQRTHQLIIQDRIPDFSRQLVQLLILVNSFSQLTPPRRFFLQIHGLLPCVQGSHSSWKNDNSFSSPGKVLEFYNFIKNPGKMGVNLEK